jgi:uncharacterized membrane protein
MNNKKFRILQMVFAMMLSLMIGVLVSLRQPILAVLVMLAAVGVMMSLRKKVTETVADERDYAIGGNAARYALTAYAYVSAVVGVFLVASQSTNPAIEAVGITLAYSACGLLIAYSIIYQYLSKTANRKQFLFQIIAMVMVTAMFVVAGIRVFSSEDGWTCQNGEWVKHGNPTAEMPSRICTK